MQHQLGTLGAKLAIGTGLLLPLLLYGGRAAQRPPQTNEVRSLFRGIEYRREARSVPRPQMIHIVKIDLTAPGVRARVTPSRPTGDVEVAARTTSAFVEEFDLQLAVNASFFYRFEEKTPWDYYPRSGDRVNVLGQAIGAGQPYSPPQQRWAVLCFDADSRAQILDAACPAGTQDAIAGNAVLLRSGQPVAAEHLPDGWERPYARLVAAIDQTGETLWLVAVDGKQPLYSEGATLMELAELVQQLGAAAALNLDGGGSTTVVMASAAGTAVLNAPIHTKLPLRERPVGNHLGFSARPIE